MKRQPVVVQNHTYFYLAFDAYGQGWQFSCFNRRNISYKLIVNRLKLIQLIDQHFKVKFYTINLKFMMFFTNISNRDTLKSGTCINFKCIWLRMDCYLLKSIWRVDTKFFSVFINRGAFKMPCRQETGLLISTKSEKF